MWRRTWCTPRWILVSDTGELVQGASPSWAGTRRTGYARVRRVAGQHRMLIAGALISAMLSTAAIGAPGLAPFHADRPDMASLLAAPSTRHWLGTDDLGRDQLSRLMFGGRISLAVGGIAMAVALAFGVAVGLVAGYAGRWVDHAAMLVMDVLSAFPTLVLAVVIVGVFGPGIVNATLAIGVVAIPRFARLVRSQVLVLREYEYVHAARAVGASTARIIWSHLAPGVRGVMIVQATLTVGFAILTEASLSFLGLGVQPPTPTWGSMLRFGYPFLPTAPWLALVPGAAIAVAVLGFNLLGDGLRDALDPRLHHH
jgi:peptide/nickel transport system permease protein